MNNEDILTDRSNNIDYIWQISLLQPIAFMIHIFTTSTNNIPKRSSNLTDNERV